MDVKIIKFPETKVAVLEHRGSPALEPNSIKKFIAWRIENKLALDKHQNYGVHYNDPATVPPEEYKVDLCISVEKDISPNEYGIKNKIIPAGDCAIARHIGSRSNVTAASYLYNEWLPESGKTLRDFPIFFHYVNIGPNVLEKDMITDVYLPIN